MPGRKCSSVSRHLLSINRARQLDLALFLGQAVCDDPALIQEFESGRAVRSDRQHDSRGALDVPHLQQRRIVAPLAKE